MPKYKILHANLTAVPVIGAVMRADAREPLSEEVEADYFSLEDGWVYFKTTDRTICLALPEYHVASIRRVETPAA
ncbi:hypothetical protein [Subtercola vilae]|uniref:hypothetical protein n=1 Tax=Subtercola vilae TaxID=2056433 RepID=UPI0010AAB23A|nr:hypothetical protein [Subtercola vilae]